MSKLSWMLTAAALTLPAVAHVAPAEACSPQYELLRIDAPAQSEQDRVRFTLHGEWIADTQIEISQDGSVVDGSIELVDNMATFTPTAPLPVGPLTITAVQDDLSVEVEIVEVVELITNFELTPKIDRASTGLVCCDNSLMCEDFCGGCVTCWSAGYEYSRGVDVAVETTVPLMVTAELVGGLTQVRPVASSGSMSLYGADLGADETCVVVTFATPEGEEVSREERCLADTDFPAFEDVQPDEPDAVAQCVRPPDDESDPNWQRYGKGGCSVTADGTINGWPLLLGFIMVGARRRKR